MANTDKARVMKYWYKKVEAGVTHVAIGTRDCELCFFPIDVIIDAMMEDFNELCQCRNGVHLKEFTFNGARCRNLTMKKFLNKATSHYSYKEGMSAEDVEKFAAECINGEWTGDKTGHKWDACNERLGIYVEVKAKKGWVDSSGQ